MAITKGAALFAAVVCVMLATTVASQDLCSTRPCSPGGTCSVINAESGAYATCSCDENHLFIANGPSCAPLISCSEAEDTCGNNGKCRKTANGHYKFCECNPNYVSDTVSGVEKCVALSCATEPSPCGPMGRKCTDLYPGIKCKCYPGYTGEYCTDESNACDTNPCGKGGECTADASGYACTCGSGYKLTSRGKLQTCVKEKSSRKTGPQH